MTVWIEPKARKGAAAALAGAVSLLTVACQQPAETTTSSQAAGEVAAVKTSDVCALVPKEAVGEIIAQPIVNATPASDSCKYETDDAMASSVEIVVKRDGAAAEMETARQAAGALGALGAEMDGGEGAVGDLGKALQAGGSLAGVGKQAFFDSTSTLHVLHDGAYIAVTPPMMKSRMAAGNPMLSVEERQAMARAIMLKALAAG